MSHPMSGPYARDPAAGAILAFHQQNNLLLRFIEFKSWISWLRVSSRNTA
jgi:hypothetical protein